MQALSTVLAAQCLLPVSLHCKRLLLLLAVAPGITCTPPTRRLAHLAVIHVSTLKEAPAGSVIVGAVTAIRSRAVKQRDDGHLEMPAGVEWPVAKSRLLFVRRFYAPPFEDVRVALFMFACRWYLIWRVLIEQPDSTISTRRTR